MNGDGFIRWALDDARTIEERYTTELLVELGVGWWHSRNNTGRHQSLEEKMEISRQRALNPAYEPRYSEVELSQAVAAWPTVKTWWFSPGHQERPIRDATAFGFFRHLEEIHLLNCEVVDVNVFAQLPQLHVLKFSSGQCEDLSPLAACVHLRELELGIGVSWRQIITRWPEVRGLEKLEQLEKLSLTGNLHVFPRGITWPKVRRAMLKCEPLPMRNVRELPQLPACEFLTLGGVERLDGIEAFSHLRNLKLETNTRDFAPLTSLDKLTCLTCSGFEPLDVSPLARLQNLQIVTFNAHYEFAVNVPKPRDFMPFADAPALRELHALNCPPVASEVQMLNSLLPPWDDVLLLATTRSLSPWRMIIAPMEKFPRCADVAEPEYDGLLDEGLREAEGRWAKIFMEKTISAKLGAADWGTAVCDATRRLFTVTIESFAVMEKFPLILDAMREGLARLRYHYTANLLVCLKAPAPAATPAQIELEAQFQEEKDKAEYEHRQQERKEYLERLHRYELKKQLGEKIKPEDFVPPPPKDMPLPPWERESEDDEDNGLAGGDVLVKEKPDPPPSLFGDEHPLADHYRAYGYMTLSEIWFLPYCRDLVIYLTGHQPDEEIPEDTKS